MHSRQPLRPPPVASGAPLLLSSPEDMSHTPPQGSESTLWCNISAKQLLLHCTESRRDEWDFQGGNCTGVSLKDTAPGSSASPCHRSHTPVPSDSKSWVTLGPAVSERSHSPRTPGMEAGKNAALLQWSGDSRAPAGSSAPPGEDMKCPTSVIQELRSHVYCFSALHEKCQRQALHVYEGKGELSMNARSVHRVIQAGSHSLCRHRQCTTCLFLCHDLLFLCSPASASISLTTHQDSHGPRAVCRAGITHLSSTRAFTPVHTQRLVQSYTVKTITASSSVAGKIHCTDSNEAESSLGDHTALCVYVTPSGQGGSTRAASAVSKALSLSSAS